MEVTSTTIQHVDLTTLCPSFPTQDDSDIFRGSLVKQIRDMFSRDRKVIVVEGASQSGKTTLVSQFAKQFCDRTISYFVGDDYWTTNSDSFLQEVFTQMVHIPGLVQSGKLRQLNLEELEPHQLLQAVNRLYANMRSCAQRIGPFYFVIDGVDKIRRVMGEQTLLDFVPSGADNIYVLLTATNAASVRNNGIVFERLPIQWLSKEETEKFLGGCFDPHEIEEIYRICDGMPGYIKEIRRQVQSGIPAKDILDHMPERFSDFVERQWLELNHSDVSLMELLSLVTFGPPLHVSALGNILNLSHSDIESRVACLSFVTIVNGEVIIQKAYKDLLAMKLANNKVLVNEKLIRFYESIQGDKLQSALPELYQGNDRYDELARLISTKSIVENLSISRQLSRSRHNLRILSTMAYEHHDWGRLAWANVAEAVFSRSAVSTSAWESEVGALLSLKNYTRALEIAASCALPEDRLNHIATVCNYMVKNSIDIPEHVIQILEDSIGLIDYSLDPSEAVIDRLMDVCANILPVRAQLALDLLEKVASGASGIKQNLLDFLVTRLLQASQTEFDTAEEMQTKLSIPERKSLVSALHSATEGIPAQTILEQVEAISDVPTKLFLMQTWCGANLHDVGAIAVIEAALKIMIGSSDDSPTLSNLRELARPLLYHDDVTSVQDLVSRIDLIKETLLKHPMDQYAWLELTLSRIVKRWCPDSAERRLYEIYFELEKITDVDTRCYVLARILRNIPDIVPDDTSLAEEIRTQLEREYSELLFSSADQLTISKRLIETVAIYSVQMAVDFADKLNTQHRRNLAYAEIMRVYTSGNKGELDFAVIEHILDKIALKPYRDLVLVHTLERVSEEKDIVSSVKHKFIERVKEIDSPTGRTFGLAHCVRWINGDVRTDKLYREMLDSLNIIESLTNRIEVGFRVVELLSEFSSEYADNLYERTAKWKANRVFSDTRVEELYSETCRLLLRTIPDVVQLSDWREKVELAKSAIMYVPSISERAELLANLAIRCNLAGKHDSFKAIARTCLDFFEQSGDSNTKVKMLLEIAPMMFEFERGLLFEKVETLPEPIQDAVLSRVVTYIISKRPNGDPVELGKFHGRIEVVDAIRVAEVLEHMYQDGIIYSVISNLVDCIVYNVHTYRNFAERQLLSIATRLKDIIEKTLPDLHNIQHQGYVLVSEAQLARLRALASQIHSGVRANHRWQTLCPTWAEIQLKANAIDNVSDKVYVMATCGVMASKFDDAMSRRFLSAAEEIHGDINNHIDRADRFQLLADSYYKAEQERNAQLILIQALEAANSCSREEGRDALLAKSSELAYSIDPALADSILSKIDSDAGRARIRDNFLALTLHSDPSRLDGLNLSERQRVLHHAALRVLESLCSGRGIVQHEQVIGKWMYCAVGQDFDTIDVVTSWFIENSILGRRQVTAGLESFFNGTMEILEMLKFIGSGLENSSGERKSAEFYSALSNVETYHVGERQEALESIYRWLTENSEEYVKIYDPYFGTKELELLRHLPAGITVTICTTAKTGEVEGKDCKSEYRKAWQVLCDLVPPRTKVFMFHSRSGRTPLHNRYIITKNAGVEMGTSLNGFGTRDSTIRYLDLSQKAQIEEELVDSLIVTTPREHMGEELNIEMFVL